MRKNLMEIFAALFLLCSCNVVFGFERVPLIVDGELGLERALEQSGMLASSRQTAINVGQNTKIIHVLWDFGSGIPSYISYIYICRQSQCLFLSSRFTGNTSVEMRFVSGKKAIELTGGGKRYLSLENVM